MASINYLTLRPEQALKIYEDYAWEEKYSEALSFLYRYISSFGSRNRKTYADQTEVSVASNIQHLYKLMNSYIDLRLKLGINNPEEQNQLKEVFKTFRQMTQHNHFQSFFEVLSNYRSQVEKMFEERTKDYSIEDLQKLPFVGQISYEEPAEDLLYLSFDPQEKRLKDQQKACLRILWDTYRTIMENVKWNEKMEEVYFDALKRVSSFCLKYKRKGEFNWFCSQINGFVLEHKDIDIRKNLSQVDLAKPATNDKHVLARFEIVKTAISLEMWIEAFKILESIMVLKQLRRGVFRQAYLLQYYDFLQQLFAKSGNRLYQAFAYYNHYLAFKKRPVQNEQEIAEKQAQMGDKLNHLVLSVLVIPYNEQVQRERVPLFEQGAKIPTREELIKILGEINAIQFVSPVVRKVYELLEEKQDLLTVASFNFEELVGFKQYIPLIKENLIGLVLETVSKMYRIIKLESLYKLVPFADQDRVFQLLIYSHKSLQCKVDFKNQVIHFQKTPSSELSVIPSLLYKLQLPKATADPTEQAKKQLDLANLKMQSRKQTIEKLIRQADPVVVEREQKEAKEQEKLLQQQRRKEEEEKLRFIQERTMEMEQRKAKEIAVRQRLLQDIIKLKGTKLVTLEINGDRKRLEHINEQDLVVIDSGILQDIKKKFEEDARKGADDKYLRGFRRTDYIERERQIYETKVIETWVETDVADIQEKHKKSYQEKLALKQSLVKTFALVKAQKEKIQRVKEQEHAEQLQQWSAQLTKKFTNELLELAQSLYQEHEKRERQKQRQAASQNNSLGLRPLRDYDNSQKSSADAAIPGSIQIVRNSEQPLVATPQSSIPTGSSQYPSQSQATGTFTLSRSSISASQTQTQKQQQPQQEPQQQQQQQPQQQQRQQGQPYRSDNNRFAAFKPTVNIQRNTN